MIALLRRESPRQALLSPAAVVFVSDPERNIEPPTAILRRFYGFTQTEAAIAAMIVQGHDLKHTADCLGMTFETARGYPCNSANTMGCAITALPDAAEMTGARGRKDQIPR